MTCCVFDIDSPAFWSLINAVWVKWVEEAQAVSANKSPAQGLANDNCSGILFD